MVRDGGMAVRASFDKLRMRMIENGICPMPLRTYLILSLSKDARWFCRERLGPARACGRKRPASEQRVDPAAAQRRHMHEDVFAAAIGRDEAIALFRLEPFDRAFERLRRTGGAG